MGNQPGEQFGRYELVSQLGRGGMAETWRARLMGAAGVTKPVLIKKVLPEYANDQAFSAMFVSEARITATLSHGNIAQVFDFGRVDGEYFLAMELVDGQPLNRVIKRAQKSGLPALPVPLATYIAMEMCRGLHYAHTRTDDAGVSLGIVHRDISPDNVLISYEGQVKIVDFGIAKARELRNFKTEPGVVKGKYLFFSPEQARGEEVDARTDVWATGVVLYEMLCGRLPLEGPPYVVLRKLVQGEFPQPRTLRPELPDELNDIIMRALAVETESRFESCHEFGDALAGFLYATAPRFSAMSLSHLVKELFRQDLAGEGREARVPHSFLEELAMWRGEPQPPAKQAATSAEPRRRRTSVAPREETRDEAPVEPPTAEQVPAASPRSRGALLAAAGGALALGLGVAALAMIPGESSTHDPSKPMPLPRPPAALKVEQQAPPSAALARTPPPAPKEEARPAPQPSESAAPKAPPSPPPAKAFTLDARAHVVLLPTQLESVATLQPEERYRVYEPNPPPYAPPLFFLFTGPYLPADDGLGTLSKQPTQVTGVLKAQFFTVGPVPEGASTRTVRVENVRTRMRTLLLVDPSKAAAPLENAFEFSGLEGSTRYELNLVPSREGAFTRGAANGPTQKVACARQLAPEASRQAGDRMRLSQEQHFLLQVGKPFVLEEARALSCGFIDDDPSDNQGGVEIRITEFSKQHVSGAPSPAPASPASGTSVRSTPTPGEGGPLLLLAEASQLINGKQYGEALSLLDACIRLDPTNADCYLRRGVAHAGLGNLSAGAESYRRFVKLAPNHPQASKVRQMVEAYDAKKRAMGGY